MTRWLPWVMLAGALVALGTALWSPDATAVRLGFGERLEARQNDLWQRRLRAHYRRLDGTAPAGATIFLGASSIQGLATSRVRSCSVSFGIGGETSTELAARVGDYRSLDRAAAIVVMTGVNDVLRHRGGDVGPAARRLLAALPPHVPVLLSSTARLADPLRSGGGGMTAVNLALRDACSARKSCRFVDLYGAMKTPATLLEADGIHLNPQGYSLWISLLRRELDAAGVPDRPC